jgi:cell wall-associated NlpC family hydrolase
MSFQVCASPSSLPSRLSSGTNIQEYKNWNDNVEKQIEIMDNQIEKNIAALEKYNQTLKNLNDGISKNEKELSSINKSIKDTSDIAQKRIREMYVTGLGQNYINILLSSKNFNDLISKSIIIKTLMDFDDHNIKKLESDKKSRESIVRKLKQDKDKTEKLKSDISKKIDLMNEQKESQKKLLSVLNSSDPSERADFENSLSRGGFTSTNDVVNYALSFLGVPYVWGGTSPEGFDCSGFVQYVYAHFGVNLPRVSQDQQNFGIPVPKGELQPGDLVFFGTPAYHVGMYIGNGKFIEAPHTGDIVKIANLGDYTSAMRVR